MKILVICEITENIYKSWQYIYWKCVNIYEIDFKIYMKNGEIYMKIPRWCPDEVRTHRWSGDVAWLTLIFEIIFVVPCRHLNQQQLFRWAQKRRRRSSTLFIYLLSTYPRNFLRWFDFISLVLILVFLQVFIPIFLLFSLVLQISYCFFSLMLLPDSLQETGPLHESFFGAHRNSDISFTFIVRK